MRKLLLLSLALTVLMSCKKDDETGIPPIDGQQKQSSSVLDAKTATVNDYKDGKKVSLKGNITVKGTYSYIIFSDKTEVQIFAHKSIVENFSQETKKKLATQGQEVTVTGTFKDHKLKNGTVIKEILYEKESDLVFGNVTAPNETITELDTKTATVNDYVEDKKVKLKGVVSVKNNRTYLNFSDGTEIQVYVTGYTKLDQSIKTKLNTAGQELTATGTFKTYNNTRQIQVASGSDLVFGNVVTQDNNNQGGSQNGNQGGGNQSGNTTSNVFDFESITPSNHYNETGTLTGADGVTLTYKARTDVDKFGITGKGLMLTDNNTYGLSYIKITFPNGVKEISFDYKEAFSGKFERHFLIYEGDENSTTKIDEVKFKGQNKYTKELNKKGSYTITIKAAKGTRQFVIDNFSWK
jgi:nucleic acid-binding domain protein